MFSEDLEPKGGILSPRKKVRRYLGIVERYSWWCRRNCVTERRRRWKTRRERRDGSGIIYKDKRSGLRCCDVGRCGVVVTIRNDGVVCKIMG